MEKAIAILAILAVIIVFTFLGACILMLLWNWIVGGVFGWITLTFWQALGVSFLINIIFNRGGKSNE